MDTCLLSDTVVGDRKDKRSLRECSVAWMWDLQTPTIPFCGWAPMSVGSARHACNFLPPSHILLSSSFSLVHTPSKMPSRASTVYTVAGITVLGGLVAYAVYFDYKRRNYVEFRKKLRQSI